MRTAARVLALTTSALVMVGLTPGLALAADGTASVVSTNGLAGVSSASNSATVVVVLSTSDNYLFNLATSTGPTVTFSRNGTTGLDAVTGTITAGSATPPAPGQANSFTLNVPLTSANSGSYDITVSGATLTAPSQNDVCTNCYTVLSSAPVVSSVTPTKIARNGSTTLTVLGGNFAKGNYPAPNSNYACTACTNGPKLQVRVHGASIPDPGITLSDPVSGQTSAPIPATASSMGKVITVAPSATLGAHDIYVENTDGQFFTLDNALTVDASMVVSTVVPTTRGQGSTGGTLTLTGTDFPTDVAGTITVSGNGNTNGVTYSFVRDSATQLRFVNVAVASNATVLGRTITLSSVSESQTLTNTSFSVTAAPAPATRALADSTVSKYGQGATNVRVAVTGTGFTAGSDAAGTQVVFTPSTGITVVSQSSTTTTATAVITLAPSTPVATVTLSVLNPDGGTGSCSTACTFAVDAAPHITAITPNSEGRGQTTTLALTGTNLADGTVKSAPTVTVGNATHGATSATSATAASVASVLASSTAVGAQDVVLKNNDDQGQTTCTGCFTITSLAVTGTSNGSAFNDHTVSAVATGAGFDPTATVSLVKTGSGSTTVPAISGVVTSAPVESSAGAADGTSITASFNLSGVDPGTYAFKVTNPDGTPFPGVGQGGQYSVIANAPTVASVSPSSRGAGAVNQTVVISGTGFGPNATVAFSNAAVHADSVTRDSATQITVVLHIDAGVAADSTGTVTVTNTDTQHAQSGFAIVTGPHINSVAPGSRGQDTSTTVTVKGTQGTLPTAAHTSLTFTGGTGVTASGFAVTPGSPGTPPVVPPTDDTLTGTLAVSDTATVGSYAVVLLDTSTGGRDVCAGCFVVHAKPTVTSVTPFDGAVGTSVPVTIAGTGFLTSPTVTVSAGVTVSNVVQTSATSITATFAIPAGAAPDSLVDVTVTNTDGGFASKTGAFHLFGKPGAPTIGTATPGNAKATVTWSAPASDGGSAVTSYTATASPGGATMSIAAPATSVDVPGLTNGTSYTFTVHATNAAGNSLESAASAAATPRTVPGKPTGVSGTPSDRSSTVSWTAPANNGGATITGYTVTASPGGATATVDGAQRSAAVSGLTNGTAYTFTVHATNVAGDGAESDASPSVTPRSVPAAPTGVGATPGNGKATVSWTAPSDNGGATVTSYTVTATPGSATATVTAPTTSTDVIGLNNGTSYTFTVHATNVAGSGVESAASNAVTPRTVPGQPIGVSATPGDASAVVSWTAPASNGGSPITGYTITSTPAAGGPVSVDGATTSATVTGLTNGTAYSFTVQATNVAGSGAESVASSQVTPATNALAPSGVIATAGNAKATVSWTAPTNDGGSAITSYTVTSIPESHTAQVSAPALTVDVTGLSNGTSYTFTVHATNGSGDSPESAASNAVTPRTVPGAPTGVAAAPANGAAVVSWTAPASNGGSAITGYTVTSTPGSFTANAGGSATSATVSGLTNGTSYTFTVHATNIAGNGAESGASNSATPATVPGVPTAVTATPGASKATVSWTGPSDEGGSAITGYTVTASPADAAPVAVNSATTTVDVTGLTNGTSYTFTVHATNSAGSSAESAPSGAVTPRTVPGVPTGVTASSGDHAATVSWTAPASNGATITSYTVTAAPGGKTAVVNGDPAATTVAVTGLTNGTAYTFTVHATNAAGDGTESSASAAVTPAGVPDKPTGVSATAGDAQATVTWTAPANNGATITSYTVTASPGGLTASVSGNPAATQVNVAGLTNGVSYSFTVVATNVKGGSAASDPSTAVRIGTGPLAPVEKAFFIDDVDGDGLYGLYVHDTPTGTATPVTADDTANGTVDIYGLSSSRDGSRIAYVQDSYATDGTPLRERLIVRDVSGRFVRVLEDLDLNGTTFDFSAQLSADGRTAVWSQFKSGTYAIRRAGVGTGAPTTLVSGYVGATFLNNTTLFATKATDGKAYTLPVAGGSVTAAVGFPAGVDALAVSPDGSHVAWSLGTSASSASLQTAAVAVSSGVATASSVKDVSTTAFNGEPSFSRDGATVYFVHDSGSGDLWSGPVDASSPAAATATTPTHDEQDVAIATTDDGIRPGAATSLPAILNGTSATVRWSLPTDADLSGVLITRSLGATVQRANVYVPAPVTSWVDTGLVLGKTYSYGVVAVDRSARTSPTTATRNLTAVGAQPSLSTPTSLTTTRAPFPVRFASTAPSSVKFTVDYRTNSGANWARWVTSVAGVSRTFGAPAGTGVAATTSSVGSTYQFHVQARDAYGNATPIVSSAGAVVPFDQTKAAFSGGSTLSASSAWFGSYRLLKIKGSYAKITLTGNQLTIIGRRCSTCGVFDLYDGTRLVKTVDTRSSTAVNRAVLASLTFSSSGTHTFIVKVRGTAGRPDVYLDGWGMRR
jgi:hypothetical protein